MAIKRINPKATVKLVSVTDDAIDYEKSDLKAYGTSLNLEHVKFKDGAVPTYFIAQNISVPNQIDITEKHYKIIPPSRDADGKEIPAKVDVTDRTNMLLKYFEAAVKEVEEDGKVSSIMMDELHPIVVQEIGSYVMLRTTVGDELKKT
jgi:hypothetical protein